FDRAAHVDLDEVGGLCAHLVADFAIGRDRRRDRHPAAARYEPRHVSDAPDVGVAILFGEAEAFRQVGAHLVAVDQLGVTAAARELGRERVGDGRLARAGKPGEPDHETPAHDWLLSRPHRRLTAWSSTPKRLSTEMPITKMTTMIASSCCVSDRFLAD